MAVYPGYNLTIQKEIGAALIEAERTCTAPNATSIVGYAINLPNTSITFHTLMKILSGSFCIFVIFVAFFLIAGHVTHWAVPAEQKQIARVIAFLPVYATGAFISIYLYRTQPYVAPVPDFYEGFSIVAVFLLYVAFITPDESTRDQAFDNIAGQKDSKGAAKGGARVYHKTRFFVYQIIPTRIATLIATEVLYATSCPLSTKLRYGALAVQVVQSFSTNMAVIAVIRFESAHHSRLQGRNPRLKLWTFKSVVILESIEIVVFSALAATKAYRPTQYVSYYDMSIGLNQFLISCECFIYAFMYIKAFEFASYRKALKEGRHSRGSPMRAIWDIINLRDIIGGTFFAFAAWQRSQRPSETYGENNTIAANGTHSHIESGEAPIDHKLGSESPV